jgi:putative transposase
MDVIKKEPEGQRANEGKKPEMDPALIDELMKGYERPEDMTGPGGVLEQLTKRVYERILGAEMTHYLGYEKGQAPKVAGSQKRANHRNGASKKTLISEDGKLELEVPRDRTGEFEPQFVRKGQRRFGGFDQKVIALYAQGMTVREIQRFLEEQYQVEVWSRSDQHGDRFGTRRRARVAAPPLGADVPGGILRRAAQ